MAAWAHNANPFALSSLVAIVIVLVPIALRVPPVLVLIPPLVPLPPAALACFTQLAPLVIRLSAVASMVLNRFMEFVLRVLNAPLASLGVLRPRPGHRGKQESRTQCSYEQKRLFGAGTELISRAFHITPPIQVVRSVLPSRKGHTAQSNEATEQEDPSR